VLVEGRLKLDTWESNDGQKRSKLRVVGEKMQMLGGKSGGGGGPPEGGGRPAPRSKPQPQSQYSQPAPAHDDFEAPPPDMPPGDDIPF
jgi:single-strand DNA-binding protein